MSNRRGADERLIIALASGLTPDAAAERAGVCRTTLFRRMREPEFKARVEQARGDMLSRALGVLSRAAAGAAIRLAKLIHGGSNERIQLRASVELLDALCKIRDTVTIEQRLEAVEAALKARGGQP
jgi:hypothetical protein